MKLLIIEDEVVLSDSIRQYFSDGGDLCETATNLKSAIEKVGLYEYDCILLDVGLPDGSGLEILKYLKETDKDDGVIIISARNSLDDRILGLNYGADDYMTKPFHLAELKARVTAVYRRRAFNGANLLQYEGIVVNLDSMEVKVMDHEVSLTRKEFEILIHFISNKDKIITRNSIAEHLWRDEVSLSESFDFLYVHIKNLRKKIFDHAGKDYFKSVYGIGYKFG